MIAAPAALAGVMLAFGMHAGGSAGAAPAVAPPTPSARADSPLGKIGILERNRKTQPAKLAGYLGSSDPQIAARAAIAIGRLHDSAGVGLLVKTMRAAHDPQVKAAAAFGLGLIADPSSAAALSDSALHGSAPVAAAAADSLGRIGGSANVTTLVTVLYARDPQVRGKAAVGLAEAAFPNAATRLDVPLQQAAARALGSALLAERDQEARWRMAWAMSRSYPAYASATLRTLLSDREELVRVFAVRGLGKLKDRTLATSVRLLARDPSWRVRVEVRNALAAMRDPTTVDVTPPPVGKDASVLPKPLASGAPYGDHPQVAIVTAKGVIVLELFPDQAPYNVDNFLHLVDRKFYDNLQFFRVIQDFVIQGGDPTNKGDGGPGYTVPAEQNPLEQLSGVIALGLDYDGNKPRLDSGGSQYYITQSPQLHLDEAFSTFGRVVKGMAVVDAILPHEQGDAKHPSDVALHVYRCAPVTSQSADAERALRAQEIGFDAR